MNPFIEVQFTGNAKLYGYLLPTAQLPEPGDRAVVISKMKDDGTPSLSIATIVNVGECSDQAIQDHSYKPVVVVLPKTLIGVAAAAYSAGAAPR